MMKYSCCIGDADYGFHFSVDIRRYLFRALPKRSAKRTYIVYTGIVGNFTAFKSIFNILAKKKIDLSFCLLKKQC